MDAQPEEEPGGAPGPPSRAGRLPSDRALFTADVLCVLGGTVLAHAARYDESADRMNVAGLLTALAVGLVVFPVVAYALRLHQGKHELGSVDEFKDLALAVGTAAIAVAVVDFAFGTQRLLPLSVPVVGGLMAFVLAIGYRLAVKTVREGSSVPRAGRRTLVFGAGDASQQLVRSMLWDPASAYLPVGLLDDDPAKRHLRIKSVRMRGRREDLAAVAAATRAEVLVIALPSAGADLIRDVTRRARDAGLAVKVLPKLTDLLDRTGIGIRDVRDIDIADLLGRRQIETDVAEIAGYLRGKRVLVTGAGGSIGAELCRQIDRHDPAELLMLDRDESALHALQLSMFGEARLDLPQAILADIRDAPSLRRLFEERRPDVVFHAAALKHVNMLEQYPEEGWKTNVRGTANVLDAAAAVDVTHFINISTDKAADPANALGRTKRVAERLTATVARCTGRRYLSVRFGNVLGSRGSVLETFAAQIAAGGPVTVTHPEVTRYFMTIPEAVQLVIQAGAIGDAGEALVLDMGDPVRIADVARQLIRLDGRDLDIRFTGLRPGEKLHEVLLGADELDHRPRHPLISHVRVPGLPAPVLDEERATDGERGDLVDRLLHVPAPEAATTDAGMSAR